MDSVLKFPHIWVPRGFNPEKRVQAYEGGLVNGGMINSGHGLVDGGIIRGHTTGIPAPPGTPLIWLDSRQGLYTDTGLTTPAVNDGDNVKGWKDFSGNNNSPIAITAQANPVLKVNILNSNINVVRNTLTAPDMLLRKTFTWNQPEHLFVVFQMRTWSSGRYICDGGGGDQMDLFMRTSSPNIGLFAGAHGPQNSGLATTTFGIFYAFFSGSSSISRVNAGTAATGNAGTSNSGGLSLGANAAAGSGSSGTSSSVDFAAVIGYVDSSGAPNGTTEVAVRDYLNTQFTIF